MIDILLNYLTNSNAITILVLASLSVYFILTIWIFVYRLNQLNSLINIEKSSLNNLINDANINPLSKLVNCVGRASFSKEIFEACEVSLIREESIGLSWLSIISSTAPFIGLFGTVVGILETFAKFSTHSKVSFGTIAPAISEALVATAAGIFVAIFAYTFHQIISRKVYEFNTYIKSQSQILLSRK